MRCTERVQRTGVSTPIRVSERVVGHSRNHLESGADVSDEELMVKDRNVAMSAGQAHARNRVAGPTGDHRRLCDSTLSESGDRLPR